MKCTRSTGSATPRSKLSLPTWIVACSDVDCPHWAARHPEEQPGDRHFHCEKSDCFSRGLDGLGPKFVCSKPYDAGRHAEAHVRQRRLRMKHTQELWDYVTSASGVFQQRKNTKNMTQFRRRLDQGSGQRACGSAHTWKDRLLLGKQGEKGTMLSTVVERCGLLPPVGLRAARVKHHPSTSLPVPGSIVRFNKSEEGEVWYGVCCSSFETVEVYGEVGLGCTVKWLEESHKGQHRGREATFYEAVGRVQPQLFETMQTWGDLLVHDTETGMFMLYSDPAVMEAELRSYVGSGNDVDWSRWNSDSAPSAAKEGMSEEERIVFEGVFRTRAQYLVDDNGREVEPTSCSPGAAGCRWGKKKTKNFKKCPLVTKHGPIFLRPVQYYCSKHNKYILAGECKQAQHTNVECLRIGYTMYDSGYVPELQAGYVDTLNMQSCRRRILDGWLTSAMEHLKKVKKLQVTMGLSSSKLQAACTCLLALPEFVPSVQTLTNLQLLLFQQLVQPRIPAYDLAVAAFDGQFIRVDGTFKIAANVRVHDPIDVSKRVYRKVGTAVLVAVGLEGLVLTTPTLVPGENRKAIADVVGRVLRCRRTVLGSLSAPSGFVSDCIRQTQAVFWDVTQKVYPEFAMSNTAVFGRTGTWKQEAMLMLQDIAHREWAFTRKAASKKHPDYHMYKACIKDVFHQLRVPHDYSLHGPQMLSDLERDWHVLTDSWHDVGGAIRTAVLDGANATAEDDRSRTSERARSHTRTNHTMQ